MAVTPVVSGVAPATPPEQSRARVREAFMAAAGLDHTATAVAGIYADIVDAFVLDERDAGEADAIRALGIEVVTRRHPGHRGRPGGAGRNGPRPAATGDAAHLTQSPAERGEAFEVVDAFQGVGHVLREQVGVAGPVVVEDRLAAEGEALVPQVLDEVVELLRAGRHVPEGCAHLGGVGRPPVEPHHQQDDDRRSQ